MREDNLDIVERWGRIFKRSKEGLDEEQVASFVNELVRERDMLLKQEEYLFSLIRLLEKMVGGDNIVSHTVSQSHRESIDQPKEPTRPAAKEEKNPEAEVKPTRGVEEPKAEADKAGAQNRLQDLIGAAGRRGNEEPEPQWEVRILPPIDIMQALAVMTALDGLPEIEKTELIPDINKPCITVFERKPINLIDALRKLPQVIEVKGDGANGKTQRAQIVLSQKTASERGR